MILTLFAAINYVGPAPHPGVYRLGFQKRLRKSCHMDLAMRQPASYKLLLTLGSLGSVALSFSTAFLM